MLQRSILQILFYKIHSYKNEEISTPYLYSSCNHFINSLYTAFTAAPAPKPAPKSWSRAFKPVQGLLLKKIEPGPSSKLFWFPFRPKNGPCQSKRHHMIYQNLDLVFMNFGHDFGVHNEPRRCKLSSKSNTKELCQRKMHLETSAF